MPWWFDTVGIKYIYSFQSSSNWQRFFEIPGQPAENVVAVVNSLAALAELLPGLLEARDA